jgi:membrane protease YdiL (CAAX protease family)
MTVEGERQSIAIKAHGTLEREEEITRPLLSRRVRLLIEFGVIFLLAPVLIRYAIFEWRIPLAAVLQPLLLGLTLYLLWDPTFRLTRELNRAIPTREMVSIIGIFAVAGGAITAFVWLKLPEVFLGLPTNRPALWAMIMLLYPLLSVVPQELIYRTFFFHRYGPLFGDARWLAIATNGLLFGFAHIIFGSYVSIVLTAILGVLIAWRYERTRSFWGAWLEHSLFGCLIFTIGLGRYFFTGISAVP